MHFHSSPLSVRNHTFLLRPRRSAASTVPRVLASLHPKDIFPSTLSYSRVGPRLRYLDSGGRKLSRSWLAAVASPSPPSPGARAARSAAAVDTVRPQCGGWTRVAAAAALAAGAGGAGAGLESGSRGGEQAGIHPGRLPAKRRLPTAGGGLAEVSPGARRGRRLSMPSPRAGGAGPLLQEGSRSLRRSLGVKG